MKKYCFSIIVAACVSLSPVWGQGDQAPVAPGDDSPGNTQVTPQGSHDENGHAQGGNDTDAAAEHPAIGPSEIDLPVDEAVKLSIEPLFVSNLVDRVLEPSRITVKCADALSVQVFVMPVDSPYGGMALSKPRLVATDNRPAESYTLRWTGREPNPYVKLFAVVRRQRAPYVLVRSHAIDLALGGMRYAPSQPAAASRGQETQP